jgi:pyruvate formate lyase activating enzyme
MRIAGIEACSLIDYPGTVACVLFTRGCNFRCAYCHNPELVYPALFRAVLAEGEVLRFLASRRGKIDAVVVSGGEPTLHGDVREFLVQVRALGFRVKLDTNGSRPNTLKSLLDERLVDYVAMDVKAPLGRYREIARAQIDPSVIRESVGLLMRSGVEYEFRTTVPPVPFGVHDVEAIGELLFGAKVHAFQQYVPPRNAPEAVALPSLPPPDLEGFREVMEWYVERCVVRRPPGGA